MRLTTLWRVTMHVMWGWWPWGADAKGLSGLSKGRRVPPARCSAVRLNRLPFDALP